MHLHLTTKLWTFSDGEVPSLHTLTGVAAVAAEDTGNNAAAAAAAASACAA